MTIGMPACLMGDFYRTQVTMHKFMVEKGMDPAKASQGIASYIETFNAMSLKAGEEGFDHLVAEQTPGGMNERIIKELEAGGNYKNLDKAMETLLPKLLGK